MKILIEVQLRDDGALISLHTEDENNALQVMYAVEKTAQQLKELIKQVDDEEGAGAVLNCTMEKFKSIMVGKD